MYFLTASKCKRSPAMLFSDTYSKSDYFYIVFFFYFFTINGFFVLELIIYSWVHELDLSQGFLKTYIPSLVNDWQPCSERINISTKCILNLKFTAVCCFQFYGIQKMWFYLCSFIKCYIVHSSFSSVMEFSSTTSQN